MVDKYIPDDLRDVSITDTDKNYFRVVATDLNVGTTYPFQFRWQYEDKTYSEWSAVKTIVTASENTPGTPDLGASDVIGGAGFIKIIWNGKDSAGNNLTDIDRVDIYITGGTFGAGTEVVDSFKVAGVRTVSAAAGTYIVQLKAITRLGTMSPFSITRTITVTSVGEVIQAPTNPNGFSITRILGGIQVNWAGTYANGTFTGFEAIRIFVGTSATATAGTYKDAGVMTGNNVINTITVPVDGTYLRYNLPVYVHARAVNKNGVEGTLQENVASDLLGAKTAVSSDLDDLIITNAKLVADAVTAVKIATGAITETKIATDAVTSPKIVAGAVTTAKIDALAITTDKIAANAITAGKILAGEIDVSKLAANTISVNNLEAGTIKSTSYIRVGSKNVGAGTGARVEVSSAFIEDGTVDIQPGLFIYASDGTSILSAPVGTASVTMTSGSSSGRTITVASTANLLVGQTVTVTTGTGAFASGTTVVSVDSSTTFTVTTAPTTALSGATISASMTGGLTISGNLSAKTISTSSGKFSVDSNGVLTATDANFSGIVKATGGYIGGTDSGWAITTNQIARSSAYTDWLGNPQTLTTTLASNASITLSSTTAPNAALNDISSIDNLLRVTHANANTVVGPGQIEIGSIATLFGIRSTKLIAWVSAGDNAINIKWSGGETDASPESVSPAKIKWWNYNTANTGQRSANLSGNRDLNPELHRVLWVDTGGRQYLGPIFYFSTTQSTTPGAGLGENGDFYFTTA